MKVVYVAHCLGAGEGRESNRRSAAEWCGWIAETYKVAISADWIVLSGVWTEDKREMGLATDMEMIGRADEVWMVGPRVSPGMELEGSQARMLGKVVLDLTGKTRDQILASVACEPKPSDDWSVYWTARVVKAVSSALGYPEVPASDVLLREISRLVTNDVCAGNLATLIGFTGEWTTEKLRDKFAELIRRVDTTVEWSDLMTEADRVISVKGRDYTKGSMDRLANFRTAANDAGITPLQAWLVFYNKHHAAICSFIKTGGQSESEPISGRFVDALNYLRLGWLLVKEHLATDEDAIERQKRRRMVPTAAGIAAWEEANRPVESSEKTDKQDGKKEG